MTPTPPSPADLPVEPPLVARQSVLNPPSWRVEPPLVVTLLLDDQAQQRFDREREELFPPGRTVVGAHVTLFHALPGALLDDVVRRVGEGAAREPFPVRVEGILDLGGGAAYRLRSEELDAMRGELAVEWAEHLTRQDSQPFRAHVTVQNKADRELALTTLATLRERFAPTTVTATGVAVWRYEGGPWRLVRRFPFGGVREPG